MIFLAHFWLLAGALMLDALVGDPERIWRRIPHPVAVVGFLVGFLDRLLNRPGMSPWWRRVLGGIALLIVVEIALLVGLGLQRLFSTVPFGWIGTLMVAAIFLAGRSLYDHAGDVAKAFANGIDAARAAVGRIVGRDPISLDAPRICRAAIESTAENFSDGVVAPALWFLLFGLPGLIVYKAINTADSMIGHLNPRYADFGWATARLDDLANLPASRIAGLLIAVAAPAGGGSFRRAFYVMRRDAPGHRSPNAGWPEAAMAGALNVALAGPRRYDGIIVDDPFLNEHARREVRPDDIERALRVYLAANAALFVVVVVVAVALLVAS